MTNIFAPTPNGDRYACICLDPGERSTSGGLILPTAHSQKMMRWLIVSVGPGKWSSDGSQRLKPQFRAGDVVVGYKLTTYQKIPGSKASMGRDIFIIAEENLFGPIQDVEWESIPEVDGWREKGADAPWPGKEG